MKKKLWSAFLAATMAVTMLAGCGTKEAEVSEETQSSVAVETEAESTPVQADDVTVRVGAMSGPTAMGMVKLMSDAEAGQTANTYEFAELATDASAFVTPLAQGDLDIAAIPSNLASTLYNKTQGGIQVIATVNTGVLYIVERGESVQSLADLAGKTIYATGQGAVPEYTLRYLLTENGIDADKDVTIQWCADTTEALSYISADENAIAMLPQPFVTAACAQVEGLRVAVDLNDEWEKLDNGCSIITGVVVARKEFVDEHKNQVDAFLEEYEASVAYTSEDVEGAAALIEQYGIVAKAPIAQKALPNCHLLCLKGADMKAALEGFLQVVYDQNPAAVGGELPGDDFYYGL